MRESERERQINSSTINLNLPEQSWVSNIRRTRAVHGGKTGSALSDINTFASKGLNLSQMAPF